MLKRISYFLSLFLIVDGLYLIIHYLINSHPDLYLGFMVLGFGIFHSIKNKQLKG